MFMRKHYLAKAEQLERVEQAISEYKRWLAEFPDVITVLENLEAVKSGNVSFCANTPPNETGPWSTVGLREVLRRRAKSN
jgi:hypothetical protein